jgi:TetR/AcrR family transcriptional regulator, mexCD-oprJ operon repressor
MSVSPFDHPATADLAPGPARRRRADAQRNVGRIVEAAVSVLTADPGASMQEVADRSGVHRATVYRHFPTRETLLIEIRRRSFEDAQQALSACRLEEGSATEALRRLFDALAAVGDRYLLLASRMTVEPQLRDRAEELGQPILAVIERGQRSGELRSDQPVRWLAMLVGAVVMHGMQAVAEGTLAREELVSALTSSFLSGAAARPA